MPIGLLSFLWQLILYKVKYHTLFSLQLNIFTMFVFFYYFIIYLCLAFCYLFFSFFLIPVCYWMLSLLLCITFSCVWVYRDKVQIESPNISNINSDQSPVIALFWSKQTTCPLISGTYSCIWFNHIVSSDAKI